MAKKMEKGKGKEKNERKQKRGKDEEDEDYMEDGEMESEWSWREFVTARMMRMNTMLHNFTLPHLVCAESKQSPRGVQAKSELVLAKVIPSKICWIM